jgi:solute carrier family 25 (adenine nucleotide translocator) protein 4/5/6/31
LHHCKYPFEYTKTRLEADIGPNYQFEGHVDCIKKTVGIDGITGLYSGFSIHMIGIIAFRAVFFKLYDYKPVILRNRPSPIEIILFNLAASTISGIAVYPLDTIRRRLMMQQASKSKKFTGAIDCAITIVKEEGVSSLYAGCLTNTVRGLLGVVVSILGFNL